MTPTGSELEPLDQGITYATVRIPSHLICASESLVLHLSLVPLLEHKQQLHYILIFHAASDTALEALAQQICGELGTAQSSMKPVGGAAAQLSNAPSSSDDGSITISISIVSILVLLASLILLTICLFACYFM